MKILVVGGGGREHALAWKLAQSKRVEKVYCAPGNAGIAYVAECVNIAVEDIDGLMDFVRNESIDLTVVGPEVPLSLGIVDSFKKAGLKIFGPTMAAAALESSKRFAKEFCSRHGIPQARFGAFTDVDSAKEYIEGCELPIVVKADGLAAGKGVVICKTADEACDAVDDMLLSKKFGEAGHEVVIEEFLEGEEASFIAVCDGEHVLPFATSQDHKAAYDGDTGPNTGGMGAISPARIVTQELTEQVMESVMLPVARGMASDGTPFVGIIYAGLMIRDGRAKVLEFNVRLGDPETQPILMRMKDDLVDVLEAALSGELDKIELSWEDRPAVCVVMASGGYPGKYRKGDVISGFGDANSMDDIVVFHAGTSEVNGDVVTSGGRVLGVTALGDTMKSAIDKSYKAVAKIDWDGVQYRKDIGHKAL
jgi:phosphoribosylamine---glycine ligase